MSNSIANDSNPFDNAAWDNDCQPRMGQILEEEAMDEKHGLLLHPIVKTATAIPIDVTNTTRTSTTYNDASSSPSSPAPTAIVLFPVRYNSTVEMIQQEMLKVLFAALPTVVTQVCLYSLFPIATSSVGRHLSSEELAGYSLGSLMGNFTCISIILGALSAADTLLPRAYAAKRYPLLGILMVRSVIICTLFLLGPMVLLSQPHWTSTMLVRWGTEPQVALYASRWMRVYIVGIPATTIFRAIQRYCVAQEHPWPPVQASVLVTFILHPYLLRRWVHQRGLLGSAWAIVASQFIMLIALIGILIAMKRQNRCFHADSWPRLASGEFWIQVWQVGPLYRFFSLALGGVISKSDWW